MRTIKEEKRKRDDLAFYSLVINHYAPRPNVDGE